ncbi:MAG: hypothetical protein MR659_00885 [Mollicutes bacterium]|nr:hypothetical protein [Mollicutes bacterium]
MKKADIRKPIFALSLTTLLSVALGYGEWVIIASQKLNSPATSSEKKVCSIGNTYYTTVEAALTAAENNPGADTIYVIPGADPTLSVNPVTGKNTFLLSSNDTMIVAFYSDAGTKTVYKNVKEGVIKDTSEITIKNTLTLGPGVTLQVDGTLETSGRLNAGSGGQAYAGNTYGDCTRIALDTNAKITCNGTINCYGFIEETTTDNGSSLEMTNGSNLNMPFVMRDFRGGSTMAGIYKEKGSKHCFPFNQYELPNISAKTTLSHGAKLYTFSHINYKNLANQVIQTIDLPLAGPDNSFLFQTTNTTFSKIVYHRVPVIGEKDVDGIKQKFKSDISFIGGANFNSLTLSISGNSITSSEYYFPLNHYFSFKFVNPEGSENSSFSIPSMTKVMPGCNFEIGENCNVSIGDMIIYNVFNDDGRAAGDRVGGTIYPSLEPVMFWNKGTINATKLAGFVINDGIVNIIGEKALTSYEPWAQKGKGPATTITQWMKINANYSEFTSDFVANNNRILIYTKNIDKTDDVSYNYQSKTLNGYYTDYVAANTSISLSNWTNIASITINGNPYSDGSNYSVNGPTKIEVVPTAGSGEGGGGCFAKGTLIMIADGSYKKVENLHVGDIIKSFNHETGLLENQLITYIPYHPKATYQVLDLTFENNHRIKVLFAHGFMNTSTRMYEEISPFNVDTKLGQSYLFIENNKLVNRKLISYSIYNEETECYSLCTAYNLNHIVEGALCVADDIGGLYNYFDLDESYKYDAEKKEKDIERYGLLKYEDVSYILSREIYELFNVKYLSVSIGKGLTTMEQLEGYIIKFG